MTQNSIDDKSTLVLVMSWCHLASSYYLSQCWPRPASLQILYTLRGLWISDWHPAIPWIHYHDVIMGTIAFQITSLTTVYSTVYSGSDQRKHQSSASLAFVWGIHRDRWIPRTKGQLRGKCFHLMTSSWNADIFSFCHYLIELSGVDLNGMCVKSVFWIFLQKGDFFQLQCIKISVQISISHWNILKKLPWFQYTNSALSGICGKKSTGFPARY